MKREQKKKVKRWLLGIAVLLILIFVSLYISQQAKKVPDRPGEILYLSAAQVREWVKNKEIAFIQLSLPDCIACLKSSPILKSLVEELHLDYAYVNIGNVYNEWLADELDVYEVPVIWAYQNGKPLNSIIGLREPDEYRDFLLKFVSID